MQSFVRCTMQYQILLLLSTAIVLSVATKYKPLIRRCPSGWYRYGKHCYYFCHTAVTFPKAVEGCKAKGGYLVMIGDDDEDYFLKKKATSLSGAYAPKDNYWISAVCKRKPYENKCIWKHYHNSVPLAYTGWNSYKSKPSKGCAVLCGNYRWKWDYYSCTKSTAYYICEKPATYRPIVSSSSSGGSSDKGKGYRKSKGSSSSSSGSSSDKGKGYRKSKGSSSSSSDEKGGKKKYY